MSGQVFIAPEAADDLRVIWRHSASDSSIDFADQQLRSLAGATGGLVGWSVSGRPRDDLQPGVCSLSHAAHVIFYRETRAGDVEIIRVLHASRDLGGMVGA